MPEPLNSKLVHVLYCFVHMLGKGRFFIMLSMLKTHAKKVLSLTQEGDDDHSETL